ncbi:hypothetical protein FHX37_0091 [Haloactinospora alba]|uniref:Uncharacterized protein n=1 Tax=Haloactinospora alba TaxID=405555 RepID=A0A543NEQ4_9ACTN|nr:hypothetical protein FHX37_0091 [Haloactinospora alba]
MTVSDSMRALVSLGTLLVLTVVALVAPSRNRTSPPVRVPEPSAVPHRTWNHGQSGPPNLAPAPRSVSGNPIPEPEPPTYGDGLDDLRAELSPLVRRWLAQREQTSTAGVER